MKQREWMGYAAAVLAAGAFLTGCGNIRKLAKSDPEVGVHLPARSAQNPVAQAADTARTQKIITYRKQDGTELFITPVDVDSLSGEKMMSVAIDEVVISASNRRNLVERNGKINVEFVVSVPQELQARNWQLVVDPQLLKGADTLAFDPLVTAATASGRCSGANMRVTTTISDGSSTARITSSGSATREPIPAIWTAWRSSGRSMPTPKPVWNG